MNARHLLSEGEGVSQDETIYSQLIVSCGPSVAAVHGVNGFETEVSEGRVDSAQTKRRVGKV
jgi:hypothetical protein